MRKSILALAVLASATVVSAASAQSTVYAIDLRNPAGVPSRLGTFPVNTASAAGVNFISNTATFDGFALDFNSAATTLFGIQAPTAVASPNSFGTVDQTTGNFTPIAPVTGFAGTDSSAGDLTFDPTNEQAYVTSGANLYTLNTTTGGLTLVGAHGTGLLNIDLAFDRDGNLFGHDIGADNLLSINKATGAATVIGPTGLAANFAQGMDFDYATNTLYATVYTGGGTGVFASFNTTTGAATTLFSTTTLNAEFEMAVKSAIPEPSSVGLLAGAGLLALRRRRA